ncbi:MAG: hypothetical protein BGN86_10500 [Caulobacterales bacterium 68-7]|nr:MAG: hypothetical protein BGN86_10500 [Caulobacterales bacterium 68-7]
MASNNTTTVSDSGNDNSTRNIDRSNTTNNTLDLSGMRLTLSNQELNGSVSGVSFRAPSDEGSTFTTGDIRQDGGSYSGFAGVQTASLNTGLGSVNQASTSISANANITFGGQ